MKMGEGEAGAATLVATTTGDADDGETGRAGGFGEDPAASNSRVALPWLVDADDADDGDVVAATLGEDACSA